MTMEQSPESILALGVIFSVKQNGSSNIGKMGEHLCEIILKYG